METHKKRYRVMSIIDGSELYVDSFDHLEQARGCVRRIQATYHSMPQYSFTLYPRLVIVDGQSDICELAGERSTRTTRDRLETMAQIDAANDRRTREWSARHEASPRS